VRSLGILKAPFTFIAKVEESDAPVTVTVPANDTAVFQMGQCGKGGSAHILQLQVDNSDRKHPIVFDLGASKQNQIKTLTQYTEDRSSALFDSRLLASYLEHSEFFQGRVVYSNAIAKALLPSERKRILELRDQFPEKERPINTTEDLVWKDLSRSLGINISSMTEIEYTEYFYNYFSKVDESERDIDETFIFRLFSTIGVSDIDQRRILDRALTTRFSYLLDLAKSGKANQSYSKPSSRAEFTFASGLEYMYKILGKEKYKAYSSKFKEECSAPEVEKYFRSLFIAEDENFLN
jgi:hypothetical protein